MNIASLSIKRPIFITCLVTLILAVGTMAMKKLPVDLFPNVTFPIVRVLTTYPGAGPQEVETLVSKVLEDEISSIPGLKSVSSQNREGISIVIAEFTLETDIKFAEQQIRDRVSSVKSKLPTDIKEPNIRRIDPADQPVVILSLSAADASPAQLYDIADQTIKPRIEQVNQVGLVDITGGRKREIHVKLDRDKLKAREISASQVSNRIAAAGQNIPAGKADEKDKETAFRTMGEFKSIAEVGKVIVSFVGSDVPITVNDVGVVSDNLQDEVSRTYFNGQKAVLLQVYRQSGANTVAVVDAVKKRVQKINEELKAMGMKAEVSVVRDGAKPIRANLDDVEESIFIGILLTVVVVFFFLGNARSTFITGLALPNSLIGAFILMQWAGFSINVMTLLALSLAVGLLIDDAIVVRENIFRHVEMGKKPMQAALDGTNEVTLAVVATTMAVLAVFGPVGFLQGVVGQFFKEFGLTICFAMAVSLFDAMTVAPMLSAYFAGAHGAGDPNSLYGRTVGRMVKAFDRGQTWLEDKYVSTLKFTLAHPIKIILLGIAIFIVSIMSLKWVPKTFLPPQDTGEFQVVLDLPPGASLDAMNYLADRVDSKLKAHPEVQDRVLTVGGATTGPNKAVFFVLMVPAKQRKIDTTGFKEILRQELKEFAFANPTVGDIDNVGGGQRPLNVNLIGTDLAQLEDFARRLKEKVKDHPALKDVDTTWRPGKPELQVSLDNQLTQKLGASTSGVGMELRTQIEGATPSVFRENGKEYDIRVRLQDDQRNLKDSFDKTFVPNINNNLIRLTSIGKPVLTTGPATIYRQDRARYVQLQADITPGGPGMGAAMADITKLLESGELKLPPGMRYRFVGQAESFQELGQNIMIALMLGILFIYLVLASLYESFVTPFTIMLVVPLAASGAFFALLITRKSLDIFTMIGCIMLMGISTKNSILLVDYVNQLLEQGKDRATAILEGGKNRLRPILMTSIAMIAGMLPVAIGLNEASKQRTGMGIAIIGGLISSTALTLIVVPAAFSYIDRFRLWSGAKLKAIFVAKDSELHADAGAGHGEVKKAAEKTPVSAH